MGKKRRRTVPLACPACDTHVRTTDIVRGGGLPRYCPVCGASLYDEAQGGPPADDLGSPTGLHPTPTYYGWPPEAFSSSDRDGTSPAERTAWLARQGGADRQLPGENWLVPLGEAG